MSRRWEPVLGCPFQSYAAVNWKTRTRAPGIIAAIGNPERCLRSVDLGDKVAGLASKEPVAAVAVALLGIVVSGWLFWATHRLVVVVVLIVSEVAAVVFRSFGDDWCCRFCTVVEGDLVYRMCLEALGILLHSEIYFNYLYKQTKLINTWVGVRAVP